MASPGKEDSLVVMAFENPGTPPLDRKRSMSENGGGRGGGGGRIVCGGGEK